MHKNEPLIRKLAVERMEILFDLAMARTIKNRLSDKLAKRYIKIAKDISTHYKVQMPQNLKRLTCKKCNSVLIPGLNCTVRLASSKRYAIYKCDCGEEKHIFYK